MSLMPLGLLSQGGAGAGGVPAFELISSTYISTNTATVTLSSIPGTYKHLEIRATNRVTDLGTGAGSLALRLNGDTGTVYAWHHLLGNGSSVTSSGFSAQPQMNIEFGSILNGHPTGAFSANIINILDYASTTKNKTLRTFSGFAGTSSRIGLMSGLYAATTAVSSITIFNTNSASFISGSRFSLYGIKG